MRAVPFSPWVRRSIRVGTTMTALAAVAAGPAGAYAPPVDAAIASSPSSGVRAAVVPPALGPVAAPDDGMLVFSGRAFGHGRGMSQWGAYGAATKGLSWRNILDFYYPGTARTSLPDSDMRVWISADNDGSTTVAAMPGLTITTVSSGLNAPSPQLPGASGAPGPVATVLPETTTTGEKIAQWRLSRGASGRLILQFASLSGVWAPFTFPAGVSLPGENAAFGSPSVVTLLLPSGARQELRGTVHGVITGTSVKTVLSTPMETYLRGVVPNEMPPSWHPQALAAQTVAARTYAASYRQRQRARGAFYDICDSTTCQVFSGVATMSAAGGRVPRESASTDAAIKATAGVVVRTSAASGAPLAHTEFSASNGGWITSGGVPYLPAKADPYDGVVPNTSHAWTVRVPAARVAARYGLGRLKQIAVLSRAGGGDFGGRVTSAVLVGTTSTKTVTGAELAAAVGMKSGWWAVTSRSDLTRDLSGDARADVLLSAGDQLIVGRGSGSAQAPFSAYATAAGSWRDKDAVVAAGQWDGSGGQDLIARVRATGALVLYPTTREGALGRGRIILASGAGRYRSLTGAGDMDGDGYADLLGVDSSTGTLMILRGQRGGAVAAPRALASRWSSIASVIAPGDMDGDAVPDLLAVTTSGALMRYSGAGRMVGAQWRAAGVQIGRGWTSASAVWSTGDISGDGVPDLLTLSSRGVLTSYPGTGSGGFRKPVTVRSRLGSAVPAR